MSIILVDEVRKIVYERDHLQAEVTRLRAELQGAQDANHLLAITVEDLRAELEKCRDEVRLTQKTAMDSIGIVRDRENRLRALNERLVTELHDLLYHIDHGMLPINTDRSHGVLREAKAEKEG
jgi:uncharacterized protein (DUF3084 family)